MWVATHIFFSKKYQNICVSLDVKFNKSLTNDIVSFEQLGSEYYEWNSDTLLTVLKAAYSLNTELNTTKTHLFKYIENFTAKKKKKKMNFFFR